jgi:hypothetical protein
VRLQPCTLPGRWVGGPELRPRWPTVTCDEVHRSHTGKAIVCSFVNARPKEQRARSWGAGWPADEDEARERLLAAADACYAEKGPVRTRMSDIARLAGVHRSTVYY